MSVSRQELERQRRIGVGDAELFVRWLGAGPPIVCMHGGLGLDHTYLTPWLDPLGRSNSLIYYDHRGNGRSSRPADWRTVDHAVWAEDVERLRDRLGFDRVILFGHSYGAFLALEYALRHPDHVAGLILCSAAAGYGHLEAAFGYAALRATPTQLETLGRLASDPPARDEELGALWRLVLPVYVQGLDDATIQGAFARTRYSAGAFRRAIVECFPRYEVRDRLAGLDIETLVLVGRHDWVTPPKEAAEPLAAALPRAELVVFENSGHFPFIRENREFLRVVRAWLDAHAERRN